MRLWAVLIFVIMGWPVLGDTPIRVGIFGTVEGTSPLVVAGQLIDRPAGGRVISVLGANQEISTGDTLAVVAVLRAGRLVAVRVLQVYPIIGPVTAVHGKTATIMGSAVHIPAGAVVKVETTLAVSGLWSGEKAITTNVRRIEGGFAQLTGAINAQTAKLGGSAVQSISPPVAEFGTDVWILGGAPEAKGLRVDLMSKGIFGQEVDLIWWQGYATLPVASQTYMIHGTGITGAARDAQMPAPGMLIARCVREGRIIEAPPKGLKAAFSALGCAKHIPAD